METTKITKLYQMFIQAISNLKESHDSSFSISEFLEIADKAYKDILSLTDEYQNKYIQAMYENNELYSFFKATENTLEQKNKENILKLENDEKEEITNYNNILEKSNKNSIAKYKEYENLYLPKATFLKENKKQNKELYIKAIIKINEERTKANHEYQEVSLDLDNKNEQKRNDFKHSEERIVQKNDEILNRLKDELAANLEAVNKRQNEASQEYSRRISLKERYTANNAVSLNDDITKLSLEYDNRRKYGYVPYDLELNNLLDEQNENASTYSKTEESILNNFKEQLTHNDNEIGYLKEEQKIYENEYQEKLDKLEKHFCDLTNEINTEYEKQIVNLNQKRNSYSALAFLDCKKELAKVKNAKLNTLMATKRLELKILNQSFLLKEYEYIDRFEHLRADKTIFEATKSNAMKNLNLEKDYNQALINAKNLLLSQNKEAFVSIEQYDENKKVLLLRLNHDLENASITYDVNELELEEKRNKEILAIEKKRLEVESNYQMKLLDADTTYQKRINVNRKNYANVTNMLDVGHSKLIKNYKNDVAKLKVEYEKKQIDFYYECDNIQYQLYKLSHDINNKEIDYEMEYNAKITDLNKQHIEMMNEHNIRALNNTNYYQNNRAKINLYTKRFEVEKSIIIEAFELLFNTTNKIIGLENILLTSFTTYSEKRFTMYRKFFLNGLEYLRQIKQEFLNEYYQNVNTIIETRIHFEQDVKYTQIIENLKNERKTYIDQVNNRREKLVETINSYHSTIKVFNTNLNEYEKRRNNLLQQIKNGKKQLHQKKINLDSFNEIKERYQSNYNRLKSQRHQIKINLLNIKELSKRLNRLKDEAESFEQKYSKQLQHLNKAQNAEAKAYYDTITLIKQHYNTLKFKNNYNSTLLNQSKYFYRNALTNNNRAIANNNRYLNDLRNIFEIHYNFLTNSVNNQIKALDNNYYQSYIRYKNEIDASIYNEKLAHATKLNTTNSMYRAYYENLKRNYEIEKTTLYNSLQKAMNIMLKDQNQLTLDVKALKKQLDYNLKCHQDNYDAYNYDYKKEIFNAKKDYQTLINNARFYQKNSNKELDNEIKHLNKSTKTHHISNENLKKNMIAEIHDDYHTNVKHANLKIHNVHLANRENKLTFEQTKKRLYHDYIANQRNNRIDSILTYEGIKRRTNKRIKLLIKEYHKNKTNK